MKPLSYNLQLLKDQITELIEEELPQAGFVLEMGESSQEIDGYKTSLNFTLDAIEYEVTIKEK